MKTIGIKLADGSFFPVLEDNHPAQKALELTTAHNNQTKVMVDLYRSKNCSMDDAEYVDSLQIDNLVSHPNGEPSIAFSVSLDENSQLSANIKDPETGHQSETAIPLVTRTEEELLVPDEYDISKIDDNDKQEPTEKRGLLSAADKIMENKKKIDLDDSIFGDDALPDFSADTNNIADISDDDMFSTDDFLNFNNNKENEDNPAEDDFFENEIPDFTNSSEDNDNQEEKSDFSDIVEEPSESEDIPLESDSSDDFTLPNNDEIAEDTDSLPDFDAPTSEETTEAFDDLPDFEEPQVEDIIPQDEEKQEDFTDFDEPFATEQEENNDFADFEEPEPDSEDATEATDDLPDFDAPAPEEAPEEADELATFDEPAPEESTETFDDSINFDEPVPEENTEATDDLTTFDETALEETTETFDDLPDFDTPAPEEAPEAADELATFDEPAPEESTETFDDSINFDEPVPEEAPEAADDLTTFGETAPEETTETFDDLPDFDTPAPEEAPEATDDLTTFDEPAPEETTETFDDLPDFDAPAPEEAPEAADDLTTFDAPAPEEAPETFDDLPDFDTSEIENPINDSDSIDTELDNFPSFNDDSEPEVTDDELEKSLEESKALNNIFSKDYDDELPDFDDLQKEQEENFGLPDDFNNFDDNTDLNDENYGSDLDQFPKVSSPVDDFSLPDFPEENTAPELPDNFFDDLDDSLDTSNYNNSNYESSSSGSGPLSFTGLYDKETEMGMSGMQNDESRKTKGHVVICVICALICIIATALIFFIKPKMDGIKKSDIKQEPGTELVLDKNKISEDQQIKVVEEKSEPLPPPVPEAKEDEIIIIEQAEKVIPKQPEVVKTDLQDISYKVTWGDTLWDIANTYYKNPWKYTDIAKYNGIKNPDHIISGTTLIIPAE